MRARPRRCASSHDDTRAIGAIVLALLCGLAAPAPSRAAEVGSKTVEGCCHGSQEQVFDFNAAPGERNSVVSERISGGVRVRAAVPLKAGGDCRQVDASTAVRLGDGDDRVASHQVGLVVYGGDGDDQLVGSSVPDGLRGQAGE